MPSRIAKSFFEKMADCIIVSQSVYKRTPNIRTSNDAFFCAKYILS